MSTDMKLYVFGGDEYSVSIDPESLQILTYLRLLKPTVQSSVDVISTCKWWQSPSGYFPTLLADGKKYIGSDRIIKEFKKRGLKIDEETDNQTIEMIAFSALLKDHLRLALKFVHYMDSKNYVDITRLWFSKMSTFPVPQYLLSCQHRRIEQEIATCLPEESNLEHRGITLISGAEDCLNMLSVRLKDKPYFGGDKVSTLDAMVYGYVCIISQYQLPGNNKLQLRLNSFNNLSCFCDRMRKVAFPEIKSGYRSNTSVATGPLWKDPTVWAGVFVGGALIVVQSIRIGLFSRIIERAN